MILPIYGYGEAVLRKHCEEIANDYPNLKEVIANMYETMYNAYGVGLAAPQVGMPIRIFNLLILHPLLIAMMYSKRGSKQN